MRYARPAYICAVFGFFVAILVIAQEQVGAAPTGQQLPPNATITLVSIGANGEATNGSSYTPAVSGDGRYVAFDTGATNLDGAGVPGVFVRDLQNEVTERASLDDAGEPALIATSPSISADGRFVAFDSGAENLPDGGSQFPHAYVYDRRGRSLEIVSVNSDEAPMAGGSLWPRVSADGRYVVFASGATTQDIFLRDRLLGTTERISVTSDEEGAGETGFWTAVSDDGRYVAFESDADNLVPPGLPTTVYTGVFIRDRQAGTTTPIAAPSAPAPDGWSGCCAWMSGDARFVGFSSSARDLVAGVSGQTNSFVADRQTGQFDLAGVGPDGQPLAGGSFHSLVSADGRHVAFFSQVSNVTADAYIRDRQRGVTVRIAGGILPYFWPMAISRDGHTVAFVTSENLVSEDTNGLNDVYAFHFTSELQAPDAQSPTAGSATGSPPAGHPRAGGQPSGDDGGRAHVALLVGAVILMLSGGAAVFLRRRVRA